MSNPLSQLAGEVKKVIDENSSGFLEKFEGIKGEVQALLSAGKEAMSSDVGINIFERWKVFTEAYKAEKEKLNAAREEVKAETEDGIDDALNTEKVEKGNDEECEKAAKTVQETLDKNFKDLSKSTKGKLAADSKPEKLNAEEAEEVIKAGTMTWLDLMYKDGQKIPKSEFKKMIVNACNAQGGVNSLISTYFRKYWQEAFKLEQGQALKILGKFGVEASFGDVIGAGDASELGDALKMVSGEKSATADQVKKIAAPKIAEVFFPNTGVKKLAPILVSVRGMNVSKKKVAPELIAEMLYEISTEDLVRFITTLGGSPRKWGRVEVS